MFALAVLVAAGAVAQKPPAPPRPGAGERPPRPWSESERTADEVRMRKLLDAPVLKTPKFRDAIRNYEPGKQAGLLATWGEFVTAGGTEFVALQLAPAAGGWMKPATGVVAFGEFLDPAGRSALTFEEPLYVMQSKRDVYIERSFVFPSPKLVGTFGVAVAGEIIGMTRVTFDEEPLTRLAPGVSRLILSSDVHLLAAAQKPLDPFAFGGTKVVPKPDATFRKGDEVWVFTEVRNPGVGADRLPHLTTRVELTGNGRTVAGAPMPADASPLQGVPGHFGVGQTIDVNRFAPGDYTLRYTVIDAIAKQSFQREAPLRIGD
jgi:hypothetical protein